MMICACGMLSELEDIHDLSDVSIEIVEGIQRDTFSTL